MDLKRIGLAIGLSSIAYDDDYFQFSTFQCELLKYFRVWDILNPDRIINLEIKNEWRTSNI